ncbi:MMS19 nucleotide excision repair protein homolog isoform X2 [Ceratina calcarata]|nr:MMS19 nucleotide excision repair protein homolog isoform X2 [Ceratina calcarata]
MSSLTTNVFKERFLDAFKEDETLNTVCQEIALEIQSGHVKLYDIVETLGPLITDTDIEVREKGICAISTILSHLPNDYLNENELSFIVSFYCNRLKGHYSIIPKVLTGILATVQMTHLSKDSPERLLRTFFDNVYCQNQLTPVRYTIYLIFITLLEKRIEDLKAMGPDFIYVVISSIDGEKDPKNLMLLFSILPRFMKEFKLGHLAEDMFEVISCYFPVDYNPSGTEGITRDDLAEKLASCLCAVPEFAEYCMPIILDKLNSSVKVAKLDSLNLLCKGVYTFGVNGLKEHLTELCSWLRKEIMSGEDLEVKNASLKALAAIIEVISSDTELCESSIDYIIKDVKPCLYDAQLNLFKPSVKLLECIATVNKETCVQGLQIIMPLCLGQYSTKTSMTDKIIYIETLNTFIKIAADHGFNIKNVPELAWTDIPQLYLNDLLTPNEELQSKILSGLTLQKKYLNEVHRSSLYNQIYSLIESNSNELRTLCHTSLLNFAMLYPCEIITLIKEKYQLNDGEETKVQIRKLEVLAAVAKTHRLGREVLPQIVSQTNSDNFEISCTALSCLHKLVATKHIDYDAQHYLYERCNIIEKLSALNISPTDQRLDLILNIFRLIVRNFTFEKQQRIANRYVPILSGQASEVDAVFTINLLIPLRKDIDLAINNNLFENLYNLAVNSVHSNVRLITCKFVAVILNKMNIISEYFEHMLLYFNDRIKDNLGSDSDIDVKKATASLKVWITKAIITKGFHDVEMFLDELTDILRHDQVGQYVGTEYKILTSRHEDTLVAENFCNIAIFYKQRVFEHLIRKKSEFENSSKQNYLTALVELLEEVPIELLLMHLSKLVSLLIESLSLDNEQLIFSALVTLNSLLETEHVIFADKIQCFIPRFLTLSTYRTMRVRIAALNCLTNYCNYPVTLINTYKDDVLGKLAITIDDRKRLVRKAAV